MKIKKFDDFLNENKSGKDNCFTKNDLEDAFDAGGDIINCVSDEVAIEHFGACNFEQWYDKKYENKTSLNEGIYKDMNMNERDLKGGITDEEFGIVSKFVNDLLFRSHNNQLSDEEKVVSEILLMISQNKKLGDYDYSTYYHRRLGFIRANKDKNIKDLE